MKGFEAMKYDHRVVISNVANFPNPDDPNSEVNIAAYSTWIEGYVEEDFLSAEPSSDLYYPIFDSAVDEVTLSDDERLLNQLNMVGAIGMTFYWRDMIGSILPSGSDGVVVVFENACNQSFTYQINGPDVVYLGPGDQHDSKYDSMLLESPLNDLKEYATGDRPYTGLPLSEKSCPYKVQVYPSEDLEELGSRFNGLE